jgi:hypothetical protein
VQEGNVKKHYLAIPEIALIAGTRAALGMGLGLLLADKLGRDARKGAGVALVAVGVPTTIPIALLLLGKRPDPEAPGS